MNVETWSWLGRTVQVTGFLALVAAVATALVLTVAFLAHWLGGVGTFARQCALAAALIVVGAVGLGALVLAAGAVDWHPPAPAVVDAGPLVIPAPAPAPVEKTETAPPVEATKPSEPPPPPPAPVAEAPAPPKVSPVWKNTLGMTFVRIEPGEFRMGTTDDQVERFKRLFPTADLDPFKDEQPAHRVRITQPFSMGAHEVTVGQFRKFVVDTGYTTEGEKDDKGGFGWDSTRKGFYQDPSNIWRKPGFPQDDDQPVVHVSWNDAHAFVDWLNRTEGGSAHYRLPTEAEWEYTCRAGITTLYTSEDDDPESLARLANVGDASLDRAITGWPRLTIRADDGHPFTAPVGSYRANPWGLYDMIGNAWEWCEDGSEADYYARSPVDDPTGVPGASARIIRGACWRDNPTDVRPASRLRISPGFRSDGLGFRIAATRAG